MTLVSYPDSLTNFDEFYCQTQALVQAQLNWTEAPHLTEKVVFKKGGSITYILTTRTNIYLPC